MSSDETAVVTAEAPARDESGKWLPGCKSPNPAGGAIASYPKNHAELRELARSHVPEAIDKIVEIFRTARSKKLQLAAAAEILDRAFGKPVQAVHGVIESPIASDMSDLELARGLLWIFGNAVREVDSPRLDAEPAKINIGEVTDANDTRDIDRATNS